MITDSNRVLNTPIRNEFELFETAQQLDSMSI
jgi:hypothetical protein